MARYAGLLGGCKSFFPAQLRSAQVSSAGGESQKKKRCRCSPPLSVLRTYLIENKSHLTTEGLDTIRKIKYKMNKGKMISNDIDESLNTLKPGPPKQVLSLAAGRVRGRWLIANVGENKIETNKHTRPPLFVGTFPPSRGKLFESYEPLPSGGAADNSVALGPLGARTNLNSAPCTLERKKHYNYQKKKSRTKDDGKKVNI